VNKFATLRGAATLSGATGGELDRSLRHRELKRPHGFGDELRAPLGPWGALTLLRRDDRDPFSPADADTLDVVVATLADGLRQATLQPGHPSREPAGMLLSGQADEAAQHWLDALATPTAVLAVAARPGASARVRTETGVWLLVRSFAVGEQVAVVLEPAHAPELVAVAYDLTERERAVTELVAQGLPTGEIASRLILSPWTVQDHLKSIFAKVGVRTRGELIARVFFADEAPRLS
jgi:DNA-binding CsgD family transcriptional regulator